MKRKGLISIPLMIGLLLMAAAIPLVMKLAQNSADMRRGASSGYDECTRDSDCQAKYKCSNIVCEEIGGIKSCTACFGTSITSTPTPRRMPTRMPLPTEKPRCFSNGVKCYERIWTPSCSKCCNGSHESGGFRYCGP